MLATATHEPNLAQLLFGHQGRLGWVQALWLKRLDAVFDPQCSGQDVERNKGRDLGQATEQAAGQGEASARQFGVGMIAQKGGERAPLSQLASHLDQELKHILDPLGVFGSNSNLKGLESNS